MALTSTRLPLLWRDVRFQEVRPRLTATGRLTQSALGAALKGSTQAARNDSEGGSGGRAHAVSSDFEWYCSELRGCRSLRHSAEVAAALAPAAQSGAVVRASAEKSLKIGIRLAQALPIFSFLLSGIKPLRGYLLFHL